MISPIDRELQRGLDVKIYANVPTIRRPPISVRPPLVLLWQAYTTQPRSLGTRWQPCMMGVTLQDKPFDKRDGQAEANHGQEYRAEAVQNLYELAIHGAYVPG